MKHWKKCNTGEKNNRIKGPDPQVDGGRPESRWSAFSFRMVAAAGMMAVAAGLAVDDAGGGGTRWGRGRVQGAGGC